MLGDSTLQNWYASADSLQIKPKVIAEWNANAFAKPYIWGHGDATFEEVSTMSNATNLTITNNGSLGGTSKKFTIVFPYNNNSSSESEEHVVTYSIASPDINKVYRLSFFATSLDELLEISVLATAKDSSGNIIDQRNKNITVLPSKSTSHTVDSFSYAGDKAIATMEYTFLGRNTAFDPSTTIVIDSPRIYTIEHSEMSISQYAGVEYVFKNNRPGDPYIYNHPTNPIANQNVSPYYMAYNNFVSPDSVDSSWRKGRNFLAAYNAAFKYYFYNFTAANNTASIFTKYTNKMPVNKIIMKVNSIKNIPSSCQIYTLDSSGSWGSATTISSPFDSNGLAKIYWNGTAWTTTQWGSIPTYDNNIISLSKDIYGIKVVFTSTASSEPFMNEVHLVEISPRLELDISAYVKGFSINQELSNDSLPTPIGIVNSDTTTINFVNLPDQTTNVQPFDEFSGALAGLVGKNVNMRIIVQPFGQDSSYSETQIATMVTRAWENDGVESSTATCFDKIKSLSTIPATSFYQRGANPAMIVSSLLDSVGFTDYDYDDLVQLSDLYLKNPIPYYWTVTNKGKSVLECIQDVLLPYQTSMYTDAYGIIRFKHISEIVKSSASASYAVTDIAYGNIKPNIMEFNINNETSPSTVTVEYNTIAPSEYVNGADPLVTQSAKRFPVATFQNEILGYIRLAKTLKTTDKHLVFKYVPPFESNIGSFSGYLVIGQEIIYYDGVEYTFKITKYNAATNLISGDNKKHIVKDVGDLERIKASYFQQSGVISVSHSLTEDGNIKICNLVRGCFGSPIKEHVVGAQTSEFSTNGNISSDNYSLQINKGSGRIFATHNSTCSSKHRIFAGSFTIPPSSELPADGSIFEFGISIGASEVNTKKNSVEAGITISQTSVEAGISKYSLGVVVRQYDGSGSAVFEKTYAVSARDLNNEKNNSSTENKSMVFINRSGQNTITIMLNPDNIGATESGSKIQNLSLIINGSIIKFDDGIDVKINNETSSTLNEFTIPAIKLNSVPTVSGRKIAAYTNGKARINLYNLQGFELQDDTNKKNMNTNLTVLASVMNGNLLGLSNKNELESVIRKQRVSDTYNEIGFSPESIGRELKEYTFDFTEKASPVLFSYFDRSGYTYSEIRKTSTGESVIEVYVPPESVTASSIDHSPTQARVAIINSYNSAVYVNTSSAQNILTASTTNLYGLILKSINKPSMSQIINEDNTVSDIKLSSDWIQYEQAAADVLSTIVSAAIMKSNSIDVTLFGNPLIEVGDVLNVQYSLKNFSLTKYAVVSVQQEFEDGLTTNLVLRRLQS